MTATATAEVIPGLPPRSPQEAAAARPAAPVVALAPAASPVSALAAGGPVRIKEAPEPEPQDREPLFYIERDGVETEYTIPVVAPEYVWLNALAITAARGPGVAEVYMMQEMLGPEGWAALLGSKAMKKAHYRRMVTVVRDKVMGAEERDPNR